jgi:sarcosine oxidase subunit gamma|tara:strand:- start:695 stop:1279 length:585 start_codon:yes stop_codon:yes gene_type:complete
MKQISPLNLIHKKGKFGNFENKNDRELIKISETTNISIFQLVKFKSSNVKESEIEIDSLSLPKILNSSSNSETRILWLAPNNWLIYSSKLDLLAKEENKFNEKDFAITDLSHSRSIIDLEGDLVKEVLKKGCPLNIDQMKEGSCANSVYNGITVTIDFISSNPTKIRIFGLRSFGESLYHSLSDSSLEFGYSGL